MITRTILATFLAVLLAGCASEAIKPAADPASTPAMPDQTIMELMVTVVAPATDILWGIENPQTDEELQVYVTAADRTIAAFEQAKLGGAGPYDAIWISSSNWHAYADEAIAAAEKYKQAVVARDMDAVSEASDSLYPPCESCHADFNLAAMDR